MAHTDDRGEMPWRDHGNVLHRGWEKAWQNGVNLQEQSLCVLRSYRDFFYLFVLWENKVLTPISPSFFYWGNYFVPAQECKCYEMMKNMNPSS